MNDKVQTQAQQRHDALVEAITEAFAGQGCEVVHRLDEVTLTVPRDKLIEIAGVLKTDARFGFEQLIDACGVDYSHYGKSEWVTTASSSSGYGRGVTRAETSAEGGATRYAVVYHLLSVAKNQRLRVRVFIDDEYPVVDSVVAIWSAADWFEREAFDLYGILFDGHPDLRRILTDYGFMGHRVGKEFPLEGQVEMRYDPEKQRVVYEPVKIESRTLVPKVIREDNRYIDEQNNQQGGADA